VFAVSHVIPSISSADLRTLQKGTPERSKWEILLAFTLRGQWKFVAAVFLLSLLNFTFSGHCTSGCTRGSPGLRL